MFGHVRSYLSVVGMFFIWPLATGLQAEPVTPEQAPALRQPTSTGPSQDTQFLALLRARDPQLAVLAELRRIIAYHDNFRGRLERVLNSPELTRENLTNAINLALTRLKKVEDEVNAATELSAKIELTRNFDPEYPLFRADRPISGTPRLSPDRSETDRGRFIQIERVNAGEVFQNVSIGNREWLTKYEKLFASVESSVDSLLTPLRSLMRLPLQFYRLAGAPSFAALTANQIQVGIEKYRAALQTALTDLGTPASAESTREQLMAQADTLGRELVARSTEANSQLQNLEQSIAGQAKSLYSGKVGAESFNNLLLVFAGVFIVIMIMPRFYPEIVASNLLKSEFLLQFSTVFVLVAAIIILAIGDFIARDQLPVLLAGISGYVLGQLGKT
jgi:hypothetical protein